MTVSLLVAWAGAGAPRVDTPPAQPATGIYRDSSGPRDVTLELHVDAAGHLTGSLRAGVAYYLEGEFTGPRAFGRLYTDRPGPTSFLLFVERDVARLHVFEGESPPERLPEPSYLLRVPGPGPQAPVPAPLTVLLQEGRGETVLATGPGGVFELRDAERFMELLNFALSKVGFDGGIAGRPYLSWIERLTGLFERLDPGTQRLLAESERYWPAVFDEWGSATDPARHDLIADALLIALGAEQIETWLGEAGGSTAPASGTCSTFYGCVVGFFDEASLARAATRAPTLRLVVPDRAPAPADI